MNTLRFIECISVNLFKSDKYFLKTAHTPAVNEQATAARSAIVGQWKLPLISDDAGYIYQVPRYFIHLTDSQIILINTSNRSEGESGNWKINCEAYI